MAQILGPDGSVTGAAFLVAEDILVTCAHVIVAAGSGPGDRVPLAFPRVAGADSLEGEVLPEQWRAPEDEDVAFVRLLGTPTGIRVLPLGSAEGCRGHKVRSFGFPVQAPREGHLGFGTVGDLLLSSELAGERLQLTEANDLTTGFSGGPVLDEVTGLVIGMLTEITAPDMFGKGQNIAYVTPSQVLREIMPELAPQDVCPYRGLEPFTAEHARWFQGREEAVGQVLASLVRQQPLTLLLGPSGSGKSSLIQAGVLPALARGEVPGSDRWLPVLARPRQDLLAEIERAGLAGARRDGITAAVGRRLRSDLDHHRVLLVVDQFEELLLQGANGRLEEFLGAIDDITQATDTFTDLSVILIMRDDFYPQLAALGPRLLQAATPGPLNVPGTLSRRELHDIIVLPAENVGLRFQPGLPEQIISDVLTSSPEPAAVPGAPVTVLPLLEMTLKQLWLRRHDGYLTHKAYRQIGAVSGSLTTWCDSALNALSPGRQRVAKRVLTSLVQPADRTRRTPAVRAQVPLDELRDLAAGPEGTPGGDFDAVIAALTGHRLITTQTPRDPDQPGAPPGAPVAELIHDALIRDWGALRKWVKEDHRFQEWLNRTWERQRRWAEKEDPGDLLAGTALAEGFERSRDRGLPEDIAAFLSASRRRQQTLARRRRHLIAVLSTLLGLALLAAGIAVLQWRTAVGERQTALSRQLAVQSGTLINHDSDLAALLAIHAYHNSPTPEAVESLENAAALPLQRRLTRHTGPVYSVAFSPDGKTLATGSSDETVRLWDTATGKEVHAPLTGTGPVQSVAFSPDGKTLATGSYEVQVWDVATGKEVRTFLTGDTPVQSVVFSPDGKTLAAGSADQTVRLWDPATGKEVRAPLTGHSGAVYSVAFSPDGKTLATGSDHNAVRLWDTATGKEVRAPLTGHTDPVWSVAFSPDGKTLATGSADQTVRLWDPATGKEVRAPLTGHTNAVYSVAFSPDGKTLAAGSADQTVRLWDPATGKEVRAPLTGHTDTVQSVAFSPDGKTLATGSYDHTVRLWDTAMGKEVRAPLTGHTNAVYSVAFSPDGKTLATGSYDHTVRLWDTATGKEVRTPLTGSTDPVWSVAFSPDGKTLAIGSDDNTVRLWDPATGKEVRTPLIGTGSVQSVAFSPDGKTLATGSLDNTVRLWDPATGEEVRTPLTGTTDAVWSVAFSPDGKKLATGSEDHTVRLWDTATGKEVRAPLTGHTGAVYSVAFSPDGKKLATGSNDQTVRLWDPATGKEVRAPLTGHSGAVWSVAFSPDGKTLATGSDDNAVRLWDTATGKEVRAPLTGDTGAVYSVAFSPDGKTLATGSQDSTVRLWGVVLLQPAAAIQKICRAVNRNLTARERTAYLPDHSADPVCHTS
ncbi:trypsin-like peptidase domain-containing protein [Streptomyces sp. NPDC127069]|uniref:nSTAND1 domain-containing NTPase n=1 Tax=Streptomyces sp. NPDC127069 TaxID=3347128 RepID=UPI00366326B7